jgi:hypothetical protein
VVFPGRTLFEVDINVASACAYAQTVTFPTYLWVFKSYCNIITLNASGCQAWPVTSPSKLPHAQVAAIFFASKPFSGI